jgi:serine/threonine-protein kinase
LLGSAFLLNAISGCKYLDAALITAFGNEMLGEIWAELDTFRPIRECREIAYSGAAHGWAGILFAALNWCKVSGTAIPEMMTDRLEQLATMAQHSGRAARWHGAFA